MNKRKAHFEKITITGPLEEFQAALDYCRDNGYHVVSSGAVPISRYKFSPNRFKIVAERKEQKSESAANFEQPKPIIQAAVVGELRPRCLSTAKPST